MIALNGLLCCRGAGATISSPTRGMVGKGFLVAWSLGLCGENSQKRLWVTKSWLLKLDGSLFHWQIYKAQEFFLFFNGVPTCLTWTRRKESNLRKKSVFSFLLCRWCWMWPSCWICGPMLEPTLLSSRCEHHRNRLGIGQQPLKNSQVSRR